MVGQWRAVYEEGARLHELGSDDAQAAVDNMHNAELYGRVLKVNLSNKGIGGNAAVWENNDEGQDDEEGKAAQGNAAE